MRKFIAVLSIFLTVSLASCGDKKNVSSEIIENMTETSIETHLPQITEVSSTTIEHGTSTSFKTEISTLNIPTSPSGDTLHYPDGGQAYEQQLEESVLDEAQKLFEKACETEWNFTVGCPYTLDLSQYIVNEYGWQYYLITTDGINSLDDVRADYHEIFSESYDDSLDEVFIESDGHVYCLNGERGSDIFYEGSDVSEITGRSEGEIRFNVINSYSDDGMNSGPYSEESEFTIVRDSDGVWRVSKFKLPY